MDYAYTYNQFWKKDSKFEDYGRNLLLNSFFPSHPENKTLLDVAGGSGIVGAWLRQRGYQVTLIDFIDVALEKAKNNVFKVIKSKIEEINWKNLGKFDYVFLGDIIEHLFDVEGLVEGVKGGF